MTSSPSVRRRVAVLFTALAFIGAACGSDDDSGSPSTAAAPSSTAPSSTSATTTVPAPVTSSGGQPTTTAGDTGPKLPEGIDTPGTLNIAISGGIQSVHVAMFAAIEGKLAEAAEHYGVKVETFLAASGSDASAALAGGSAQICVCGTARSIAAVNSGQDLEAIFNPFVGNGTVLVGAKKYESTIGGDLAGYADKTWAFASEGGTNAVAAQSVAEANGLDWGKINHVTYGDVAAGIPTLQSGRADLMAFDPVSAANAVALGVGYIIANLLDPENPVLDTSSIVSTSVWARGDFVKEYPEFVQVIVTSLVQTLHLLQDNSDSAARILDMLPKDFQDAFDDPAIWEAQWSIVKPAIGGTDGHFTDDNIESALEEAIRAKAITAADDSLRARFHNEFVDTAYEQIG